MSPEILNEAGHEVSSDWWSLGIVLYELATGNPPFSSRNIEQIADDIRFEEIKMKDFFSSDLKSLIDGLTTKDPKKRLGHPLRGGVAQVKLHPFFKKVNWEYVYNKVLEPPIVPEKKKGVQDLVSGDANPYRLLE
jgi:serine/threonine protein kinase